MFIPTVGNDGVPFEARDFKAFEAAAVRLFGGVTRLPGLATGSWLDETEKLFRDRSRQYLVAMGSLTEGDKLAQLVRFAKEHFAQKAIYVRYLGLSEII